MGFLSKVSRARCLSWHQPAETLQLFCIHYHSGKGRDVTAFSIGSLMPLPQVGNTYAAQNVYLVEFISAITFSCCFTGIFSQQLHRDRPDLPMASKEEPLGFVGAGFFYRYDAVYRWTIDFSPEMSMITRSILKKWQRWSISLLLILASLCVDDDCRAERMAALMRYLKARPSAEVEPASIGTVIVDDSVVKLIEEEVTRTNVSLADDFASLFCHYW